MAHLLHARNRIADKITGGLCPRGAYRTAGKMNNKLTFLSLMCNLESSEGRKAKWDPETKRCGRSRVLDWPKIGKLLVSVKDLRILDSLIVLCICLWAPSMYHTAIVSVSLPALPWPCHTLLCILMTSHGPSTYLVLVGCVLINNNESSDSTD